MTTTRKTLLDRVRDPRDQAAWEEFYRLYAPLLYDFARRRGLVRSDAEEVRDHCLEILVRRMQDFEYDPSRGRFKSWLFAIVNSKVMDLHRARRAEHLIAPPDATLVDPSAGPAETWEQRWRVRMLLHALERTSTHVPARDWHAFQGLVAGDSVAAVAARFGMNANQVYKAKSRVLALVTEALRELGDD